MVETQMVVCRACGKTVRIDQVSYDNARKAYTCNVCQGKGSSVSPKVGKKTMAAESKPSIFRGKSEPKEIMIKYSCPKCKYRFSKAKSKGATHCPYCGNKNIEEVTNDAAKIIQDSDNFNF
jgi:DNA-directed RNA polymerase subunit RPC12/RpoP